MNQYYESLGRKKKIARPKDTTDLGVLNDFGGFQPPPKRDTAPTTTPGYGQLGLDPAMGSFSETLLQPQPLSEDPALSRFSSTLLQRPPTTPVPSQGMRDVFEAKERSMNLPGSIPSGIGMDALRGQEAGVLAVPERQHQFLDFPGGVPRITHGAERLRPKELTVPPTGGLPTLIELGFTPESARQDPTALGNALIRSSVLYQGIDPSTAGQAYLDQNYPITTDVTPTVTGPIIGGSEASRKVAEDPGFQFTDMTALGPYGPYGGGPPAVIEPPPTGIPTSPNDLSPEEFEAAWLQIQSQGTLDPGAIRSVIVDAETGLTELSPQSVVLIEAFRDKEARKERATALTEQQFRAGQQYGLQEERWEAEQTQRIIDEARLTRQEELQQAQLGLAERVWNPDRDQWEMRIPSTLAERQLGQQQTEAAEAASFRRAQLAEQVTGREAQATQVQLAREQESELARLAMGVRGEPTYDEFTGRAIPGAIPSTLGQRQLEEQVTARGQQFGEQVTAREQEQQLARLAMGLGPTGPMDPTQTLAARRFEEERQLERVRMGLDPTATMDPTQTLAARQFAAQMGIGEEGREAIPYQQLELQRALAGLAGEGGEIPQTLAERQFVEQQRLANIQAGITQDQPTTEALPSRQFTEQLRQTKAEEALRDFYLGAPLGDLAGGLPDDFRTRAEAEAGRVRAQEVTEASLQRDLERTIAQMTRGLGEREQDIERRIAEISLGLDEEGRQALPSRQLAEQVRATQRGEALQQAALQGRIGGDETVAGRAQTEAERAAGIREALERAQLLGTLDGTETLEAQLARGGLTGYLDEEETLARSQLVQQAEQSKEERVLRQSLADLQVTEAGEERTLTAAESMKERELRKELVELQIKETVAGRDLERQLGMAQISGVLGEQPTLEAELARRQLTEAERAAPVREALERAQVFGAEDGAPTLEAQLARAGLTGMLDQQPTMERARLFGGAGGVPTLEAELARAGLTGMLGEDPTLARRQLTQQGETASLNALVNVFQSAMQNPYAFSAMRTMAGGGAPFENLLAPLGFAMPGQVGQGAGQFFPGGTPTMAQFAEADPEGLNYLQALLGFSGISPAQLAKQSAGITPGVRALLPPGMGTFRGRSLR